jgi:hypothetical protein
VLVMLDNDHEMPAAIVPGLADRVDAEHQVVGALAFRRSPPYDPCYFVRAAPGSPHRFDVPSKFEQKLEPCICVGTGAIAIRRSVFTALTAAGIKPPWFRYEYHDDEMTQPTEDFYFGAQCDKAGVSHWVDTSFQIPHWTKRKIGWQDWRDFLQEANREPDRVNSQFAGLGFRFTPNANGDGPERGEPAAAVDGREPAGAGAVAVSAGKRTGRRTDLRQRLGR